MEIIDFTAIGNNIVVVIVIAAIHMVAINIFAMNISGISIIDIIVITQPKKRDAVGINDSARSSHSATEVSSAATSISAFNFHSAVDY